MELVNASSSSIENEITFWTLSGTSCLTSLSHTWALFTSGANSFIRADVIICWSIRRIPILEDRVDRPMTDFSRIFYSFGISRTCRHFLARLWMVNIAPSNSIDNSAVEIDFMLGVSIKFDRIFKLPPSNRRDIR